MLLNTVFAALSQPQPRTLHKLQDAAGLPCCSRQRLAALRATCHCTGLRKGLHHPPTMIWLMGCGQQTAAVEAAASGRMEVSDMCQRSTVSVLAGLMCMLFVWECPTSPTCRQTCKTTASLGRRRAARLPCLFTNRCICLTSYKIILKHHTTAVAVHTCQSSSNS
jgi:hypothetical protein